jgi:hypothetical protein
VHREGVPEEARGEGLVPRRRSRTARPLKPAQVEALIAGYRAGRSMQALASEFGIDRRTVSTDSAAGPSPGSKGRLLIGHGWGRMSVESIFL